MKHLTLINTSLVAVVDDDDYERVLSYGEWTVTVHGYVVSVACNRDIKLHNIIKQNVPVGFVVDHKDGNKLDNTKNNLRFATAAQNAMNTKRKKNNTNYKGVYLNKRGKFISQIMKDGQSFYLGSFTEVKDAAIAYNNAAIKMFGEFAKLNVLFNE